MGSLSFGLLAASCTSERASTAALVVIDSDLAPGTELGHVDVAVYAADGRPPLLGEQGFDVASSTGAGAYALPLSFTLAPSGGTSSRSFRVVVRGRPAGSSAPTVTADLIGSFVPGELRRLDVFLARSCLGVTCQADASGAALTTCLSGSCGPVPMSSGFPAVSGDDLGGYVSTVIGADAGALTPDGGALPNPADLDAGSAPGVDAGPVDAGDTPPDAGPAPGDSGPTDGGPTDGGPTDGGPTDSGLTDSGQTDAATCAPPTSCPAGFRVGPCSCVDIDECAEPVAQASCAPTSYPCVQTVAPGYTCLGHRADWPMPDLGTGPAAAPSFTTSGTGDSALVTDHVTGLVWLARPGRNDSTAVPTYAQAEEICKSTSAGGFAFRVPSLVELVSILDPSRGAAGVSNLLADRTYFQGAAGLYWTSTQDPVTPSLRRLVSFLDGTLRAGSTTVTTARVRCVASPTPVPSGTPATRLVPVAANGQPLGYVDQRTRIGWASAVSPSTLDYAGALAYCASLSSPGGGPVRLPTYKELLTAVRLGQAAPYWDAQLSTTLGPMWSATPVAADATRAYQVDFASATGGSAATTALAYARCVSTVAP